MSTKAKSTTGMPGSKSFLSKALNKVSGKKKSPLIYSAKTGMELPCVEVERLCKYVYSSQSGPDGGVTALTPVASPPDREDTSQHHDPPAPPSASTHQAEGQCAAPAPAREIAGLPAYCWKELKHSSGYGLATSLYDCNPVTHVTSGEPVADVFGICARSNNAILALADGVNWGERAALAARSAVYGCMEYLNRELFNDDALIENTHDLFSCLLSSFDAAQRKIVEQEGFLTTLCVCVVCPIKSSNKYAACVVNVGDSYAFVYSRKHGVREITEGSHDLHSDRDLRNPGGALGPVDGHCPDLSNMTCSMSLVQATDVVFLASDGITDNFDPVVDHIALARSEIEKLQRAAAAAEAGEEPRQRNGKKERHRAGVAGSDGAVLPVVNAFERHSSSLKAMEAVVLMFERLREGACTAQELCADITQHVLKLTDPRRKVLEDPALHPAAITTTTSTTDTATAPEHMSKKDRRKRDKKVREKMLKMPGKLDHASIVAYEVGRHEVSAEARRRFEQSLSCLTSRLQRTTIRRSYRNACDTGAATAAAAAAVAYETGL